MSKCLCFKTFFNVTFFMKIFQPNKQISRRQRQPYRLSVRAHKFRCVFCWLCHMDIDYGVNHEYSAYVTNIHCSWFGCKTSDSFLLPNSFIWHFRSKFSIKLLLFPCDLFFLFFRNYLYVLCNIKWTCRNRLKMHHLPRVILAHAKWSRSVCEIFAARALPFGIPCA